MSKELSVLFDGDAMTSLYKNCTSLAKTPFLRPDLRNKPEAVLSIVLMAKELEIPPMVALTKMYFVQGQPTLPSIMKLALARRALPDLKIEIDNNYEGEYVQVTGQRDKDSVPYTSVWDMGRAAMMGLAGRDQYKKQKMTMFRHRATSEVLDVIAGDVLFGVHASEDFQDFNGKELPENPESSGIDDDIKEAVNKDREEHPEWFQVGNFYMIWNAKDKGCQFKDLSQEEMAEYHQTLEKRGKKGPLKKWEDELHHAMGMYLANFEQFRALLPDEDEENEND